MVDIKRNKSAKVANIVTNKVSFTILTKIPPNIIGNKRTIYCTPHHPFWTSDNKHRILAKHIPNTFPVKCGRTTLYSVQFETEGSYYVEMVKTDSVSPWYEDCYLPKELYFNQELYLPNIKLKGEDDPIRKKPLMLNCRDSSILSSFSNNINYHV
jgi:hypothetical protein